MVVSQITVSLQSEAAKSAVVDRIKDLVANSDECIQMTEYAEHIKLPDFNNGKKFCTGRKTVVILLAGGDPDVTVRVQDNGCCG